MRAGWLIAVLALTGALPAHSSTLLSPYNVLVFGNFTASNSDVGGGLAVGGNINVSSYAIAQSLNGQLLSSLPSDATLVVGGTLTASNAGLQAGDFYAGNIASGSTFWNNGHGTRESINPIDFADAQDFYKQLSTTVAGLSGVSTCQQVTSAPSASMTACAYNPWNTSYFVAANHGLNVFNLTSEQAQALLGLNKTVQINLAYDDSYIVFNIAGSAFTTTDWGMQIKHGSSTSSINGDNTYGANRVLFNFTSATSLNVHSLIGSVLAPNAAVSGNNGQLVGNLVAQSFSGTIEFHNRGFDGELPNLVPDPPSPVPEPSSVLLLTAALVPLGLGWLCRRKQRSRLRHQE